MFKTFTSLFIFLINPLYVVKIHKFENIATTGKLGNINPSIELIGYWSGDDDTRFWPYSRGCAAAGW